ncbi:TolB family protein [Mesorhizobium sp. UC74_2]|uniref:TolB family protein n=1 Tax=Mesorhizobium sp. UC74_2 TaxID=3350171 RepID=UPI0036720CC1
MSVLEPQDYFRLRLPSDPQISPDGRYVAYVRDWPDVIRDAWSSAVQVIDRKSGNVQDLGDGFQPRWSPESDRLAFVKAGDDANAIRLWSVATGETTAIASLPSTPEGLRPSPDGRTIAFVMRAQLVRPDQANSQTAPAWHALRTEHWARPGQYTEKLLRRIEGVDAELLPEGHHQIFLLDVATATIRQLTFDPFEHGGPLALVTKLKLAGHISGLLTAAPL